MSSNLILGLFMCNKENTYSIGENKKLETNFLNVLILVKL
jgi:hypothetical protein